MKEYKVTITVEVNVKATCNANAVSASKKLLETSLEGSEFMSVNGSAKFANYRNIKAIRAA